MNSFYAIEARNADNKHVVLENGVNALTRPEVERLRRTVKSLILSTSINKLSEVPEMITDLQASLQP